MRRYRIEQYGESFYPQHTIGYFWWCYYFREIGYETKQVISFGTYDEAEKFIKSNERKVYKV